jgi:hypothetical protein
VPVIHGADRLPSLIGIVQRIEELADRARNGKSSHDELAVGPHHHVSRKLGGQLATPVIQHFRSGEHGHPLRAFGDAGRQGKGEIVVPENVNIAASFRSTKSNDEPHPAAAFHPNGEGDLENPTFTLPRGLIDGSGSKDLPRGRGPAPERDPQVEPDTVLSQEASKTLFRV